MRSVILQILFLGLLAVGASGAYFYGPNLLKSKKSFAKIKKATERSWPVRVAKIKAGDHVVTRQVFGRVGAGRASDLSFQISGCVVDVNANLNAGVTVKKGDILARLDPRLLQLNLQGAKLKLGELQAEEKERVTKLKNLDKLEDNARQGLVLAQRSHDRQKGLVKRGVSSSVAAEKSEKVLRDARGSLVRIENDKAALNAGLNTMQARLQSARQAIDKAILQLQHGVLLAPHDGVIGRASLENGSCIGAMAPVVRLIDIGSLEIVLDVPLHMFKQLQAHASNSTKAANSGVVGQKVSVIVSDARKIDTIIERVSPEIDDKKQMVQVVVKPTSQTKKNSFISGQKVRAEINVKRLSASYKIPASAVFDDKTVFVVKDNRLVERQVTVLARDDKFAFVQGALADDQTIMVTPLSQAMPGLKVKSLEK